MIQFILMLLSLAFQNNTVNTTNDSNSTPIITQSDTNQGDAGVNPGDTGGDTGQTPPR
ncbi:hypothetical protein H5J24_23370 [Chryseobacterium capnotolerans]|uniref:hypothetical protein n=1 Tax=Chryseobacterium TaxID=59732 RepID=UPI000B2D8F04|nr:MULTISPECIES: hypothetical protein [Chryseobacterium]UHO38424.1 hypothetical protein H5J24_23370 [Chryseobacterium capnotolerans]